MRIIGAFAACTAAALGACTGRTPPTIAVAQPDQIKRRPFGKATLMLAALLLVLTPHSSRAACKTSSPCATTPMDLGTLGGDVGTSAINSEAFAVTDNGIVVGYAVNPDNLRHAFLWQNGVMVDLGTLGGVELLAFDVSNNGQVVVGAAFTTSGNHAFLWKASTGMVDLGTLGGGSVAYAVDSNGSVVVGESHTASGADHAFRWTKSSGMADIGTLGGDLARALDVNSKGDVVVGFSSLATGGNEHAFRWTAAGMTDLGSLTPGGRSQATAVDSNGSTVVGWSDALGNNGRAFRWTSSGGMSDLGSLDPTNPGAVSQAYDVSGDGSVVVGWSNAPGTGARAFRWTATTGMQNLNSLLSSAGVNMTGITLTYANAVSSKGEFIVGQGDFPGALHHAFLVRYDDGTQSKGSGPVAGVTTSESVQTSVNDLGRARQQTMIQQQALAAPLLEPVGSNQQIAFANGFSLLANAAFAENEPQHVSANDGVRAGLALRYLPKGIAGFRPLVEVGGWTEAECLIQLST